MKLKAEATDQVGTAFRRVPQSASFWLADSGLPYVCCKGVGCGIPGLEVNNQTRLEIYVLAGSTWH